MIAEAVACMREHPSDRVTLREPQWRRRVRKSRGAGGFFEIPTASAMRSQLGPKPRRSHLEVKVGITRAGGGAGSPLSALGLSKQPRDSRLAATIEIK